MRSPLNIGIRVTGLDQAKADLQQFAQGGQRSFQELEAEAKRLSTTAATTNQALSGVANRVRDLAAQMDPAGAAAIRMRTSLVDVERALKAQIITVQQAASMTSFLGQRYTQLVDDATGVSAAVRELDAQLVRQAATIVALTAKFDPATASARAMATEIAELNQAVKLGVNIAGGYDAALAGIIEKQDEGAQAAKRATQAQAELAEQTKRTQAAMIEQARAAQNAQNAQSGINASFGIGAAPASAAASAAVFKQQEQLAAAAQKYKDQLNPLLALERAYKKEVAEIAEVNKAGLLTDRERVAATGVATTAFNAHTEALKKAGAGSAAYAVSAAQVRFAVQNVGFQLNDVATQLLSGVSPFTILMQQGGQFVQAFSAGGGVVNTLKSFATSIAGMINPVSILVTGLVAVGGGILLLALRAGEAEQRLRTFNVVLDGMGTASQTTAEDLEAVAKSLQHTGTSAEDAQKAVLAFARVPNINPAFAAQILPLSRDIATVTGRDFVQVSQDIAKAIATDTEEVIKLVQSLAGPNGLSEATAKAMRELARVGDPSGAAKLAIKSLQDQMGGAFTKNMSDSAAAMNSIGAAWDNMLTKLQNTAAVQGAKDAVIGMLQGIAGALAPGGPGPNPVDQANAARNALRNPYARPLTPQQQQDIQYGAVQYSPYGALNAANTLNKDIAGLNAELQARLDAYFRYFPDKYVRSAARIGAHPSEFNAGGYGLHNRDILGAGVAADIGGLYGPDPNLARYGLRQNVPGDWRHVEPTEIPSASTALAAARMEAARRFNQMYPSAITTAPPPPPPGTAYGTGVLATPPRPEAAITPGGMTEAAKIALDDVIRQQGLLADSARKIGESKVYWEAYNASIAAGADTETRRYTAMAAGNSALDLWRIALDKASTTQKISNDLGVETARVFGTDEVAGLRAAAEAQATLAVRAGEAGDVQTKTNEILRTSATEAILATGKAIPGLVQQSAASQRLAEAAKNGAGAEHEMAVQNQVTTATHDALTKAIATGDPALVERAKSLHALTEAQIKSNDAAQQDVQIRERIIQRKDQVALVQQQSQLVGQLPETIEAANAKLTEQQKLLAQGKDLSSDISKASLANVDALNQTNIAHAEILRQQQRIDDMYKQIGDTIQSALGSVIDGIFDPKKAVDWGAQVKNMLKSLVSGIATNLFIKPLTGEILSAFGASPTAVQQFGTFGGIGGGGTGLLGPLLSGGGLLKDIFGSSSSSSGAGGGGLFGDTFSGIKDFFSGGLGGIFARTPTAADFAAGVGPVLNVPGSLFGSTTFGGFLGGAGLGFGAGSLLNSLMGGNKLTGTIGSGIGGIAGSLFGGPIGGLLGGALGSLFGMFGNNKPSNASAGANIDLSQFKITAGFAGGNQQIDQQMQQMGQSLQSFLTLLKTTGGALTGNVLLQSGVNTGITVDSSLPQYSGRFSLGKDPTTALQTIERALANSLTGISATLRTVIDQISDPAELESAIAFANAYDDMKKASDSAFASVEDATQTMGPYHTAMDALNVLFGGLTDQATRFGLALEPINAALAEATKRLQGDFLKAIDTATNEASGAGYINQIQGFVETYISNANEAFAIGLGDQATKDKLSQLFMDQVAGVLSGLTSDQLTAVLGHTFSKFNDVIDVLATTAENSTADIKAMADALAAAQKQIQAYIDTLKATPSASVSPESAFFSAQAEWQRQLPLAQAGNLDALQSITTFADQYIKDIQGYYGSSQTGQDLVAQIIAQLQGLTGIQDATTDPVVLATQDVSKNVVETGGSTVTAVTAVVTANNATAASLIAQNNTATDTLVGVTTQTAMDNIKANQDAAAAQIAQAQAGTADILAENEASRVALIDANNSASAALIAQNTDSASNLINTTMATTDALIAQQNVNSGALISSGETTASQIVEQNAAAAAAALANSETATASILAQSNAAATSQIAANDAATAALLTDADAATSLLLTSDGLTRDQMITSSTALATGIIETIAAWGAALLNVVQGGTTAIADTISAWAPLQLTATYDTAGGIDHTIADWTAAQITNDTGLANSQITSTTGLINSVVLAVYGGANSIISTIANWVGTQINNDTSLANVAINVGLTYTNALISSIYGAANSLISAGSQYSNNAIAGEAQSANNIVNWLTGIYNLGVQDYNTATNQRQDMINRLQQILDQLRLMAQTPYWPQYNTGGV